MIIKQREKPIELLQCERLLERLPSTHPSYLRIERQQAILKTGLYGERSLDYFISQLNLDKLHVHQDLRLPFSTENYMQIDFLLLTSQSIIIIESKHIKGRICVERYQMTREIDGEIESFKNPIHQIENQLSRLKSILNYHSSPIPPILPLVIFTNPNSILEIPEDYPVNQHIIRPEELLDKIPLNQHSKQDILSENQLHHVSDMLLKLHTPRSVDILKKYEIQAKDLIKGVQCISCKTFTVVRNWSWRCTQCLKVDDQAYFQAMLDYYYYYYYSTFAH